MKKISNVLQELVEENHFVKVGLSYKLFNLTQLAFFLQPLLETRLKKKIKVSAIVMNLSRYQRGLLKQGQFNSDFKIKTLTVHGNLFTASFSKTPSVHKEANDFYEFLNREGSFVTVTDSGKEITIIAEAKYIDEMKNFIEVDPVNLVENIS
ncbi:hypothetical protein HOK22_02690, partial [Candidatus Peregrinibacteria bacterium]|nr:hypothetical protein [Candidatus Peregrinibacteria bacterium]